MGNEHHHFPDTVLHIDNPRLVSSLYLLYPDSLGPISSSPILCMALPLPLPLPLSNLRCNPAGGGLSGRKDPAGSRQANAGMAHGKRNIEIPIRPGPRLTYPEIHLSLRVMAYI